MEENRELRTQEKRGEKMTMEIDMTAQVTALKVSGLPRTVNDKTEKILQKIN